MGKFGVSLYLSYLVVVGVDVPKEFFLFIRVTGVAHPTHPRTACIRVIVHDRAVVGRDVHVVSFAPRRTRAELIDFVVRRGRTQ